ncbi:MAG TPA: ABC transporter ATP-binding protein [Saprospiraceae bacterium]|nr:ABC transporter ATP-binding protein [Saprospiraceae bacterium]
MTSIDSTKAPMRRLFRAIHPFKWQFRISVFYSIINKILDLMPPFLTAWLIDTVSGETPKWISDIGMISPWDEVVFIIFLAVVIFLLESFFEWLYKKGFLKLAQNIQHHIRLHCYEKLQRKHMYFFSRQRTGNLMAILNDDINQLERFFNTSFNEIVQIIILVLVAGWSLIQESIVLGLLGMAPIPFIILGSLYYQKKVAPLYKNVREAVGNLGNRLENNISGLAVIKSFSTEEYEYTRVEKASENYRQKNFAAIRWNAVYIPLIRIFITIGFASTLLIGAYWVLHDMHGFTYGSLAFFAMMIQRLLWPITGLGRIFDEYERARAAARRIFGIIDGQEELKDGSQELPSEEKGVEVIFKGVDFSYDSDRQILKNIEFKAEPGQKVGIVGTTGAGKTTLVHLLLRFYDVSSGQLLLDKKDIRDYTLSSLRKATALVSQDVYLFHGSIRENICYGREHISDKELWATVEKAHLDRMINELPEGLDTIIGERGVRLSGGQKQRVSLARALLRSARMIILDEATSAVDTETEAALQENLGPLLQNKTSFVIAHRLSTVLDADNIIVMENGRITEQGNHEELLAHDGVYRKLWDIQSGQNPLKDS